MKSSKNNANAYTNPAAVNAPTSNLNVNILPPTNVLIKLRICSLKWWRALVIPPGIDSQTRKKIYTDVNNKNFIFIELFYNELIRNKHINIFKDIFYLS